MELKLKRAITGRTALIIHEPDCRHSGLALVIDGWRIAHRAQLLKIELIRRGRVIGTITGTSARQFLARAEQDAGTVSEQIINRMTGGDQ